MLYRDSELKLQQRYLRRNVIIVIVEIIVFECLLSTCGVYTQTYPGKSLASSDPRGKNFRKIDFSGKFFLFFCADQKLDEILGS